MWMCQGNFLLDAFPIRLTDHSCVSVFELSFRIFSCVAFRQRIQKYSSKYINPYAAGGKFCQYKIMQKTWEITETLANGCSSESTRWELSNEYQQDRV